MKFTVTFDVEDDYQQEGYTPQQSVNVFRSDLQALLYDNAEGSTRAALKGGFEIKEASE